MKKIFYLVSASLLCGVFALTALAGSFDSDAKLTKLDKKALTYAVENKFLNFSSDVIYQDQILEGKSPIFCMT